MFCFFLSYPEGMELDDPIEKISKEKKIKKEITKKIEKGTKNESENFLFKTREIYSRLNTKEISIFENFINQSKEQISLGETLEEFDHNISEDRLLGQLIYIKRAGKIIRSLRAFFKSLNQLQILSPDPELISGKDHQNLQELEENITNLLYDKYTQSALENEITQTNLTRLKGNDIRKFFILANAFLILSQDEKKKWYLASYLLELLKDKVFCSLKKYNMNSLFGENDFKFEITYTLSSLMTYGLNLYKTTAENSQEITYFQKGICSLFPNKDSQKQKILTRIFYKKKKKNSYIKGKYRNGEKLKYNNTKTMLKEEIEGSEIN